MDRIQGVFGFTQQGEMTTVRAPSPGEERMRCNPRQEEQRQWSLQLHDGLLGGTFKRAGFLVAEKKLDPLGEEAQQKEFLGFIIVTAAMTVSVPPLKMFRIKSILEAFLTRSSRKVRIVASVVGKLILLEAALGKSILAGTRLAKI
jgi:hypothetical protein